MANRLPSVVLLATVTLVAVGLAVGTDLHGVWRGAVAVTSGVVAAALTAVVISKRS